MIRLIYGLPGTGKTSEISTQIKHSLGQKKNVLLIVPEQQTVEVERNMLKLLPPSAQLNFEVLNFSRLANKFFRKFGGLSYNYITNGMKNLFMKRTLLELAPILSEYRLRMCGDSSLPSLMLSQIDEFKINSISAAKLERVSNGLDDNNPLKAKLSDFSSIFAAYEGMVKNVYDDSSDDLENLYKNILCKHNVFSGYDVYIDSFSSFTSVEHKIIEKIFSQADNTTVTIPSADTLTDALHLKSVNETSKKLMAAAGEKAEISVLKFPFRASTPTLRLLWEHLWNFAHTAKKGSVLPNDGSVSIIECTDKYTESEAVTNIILKLLQKGYRRKEIAVIAGNMEDYKGILDSILEKAEIPYFMSEKSSLLTSPLVSMILSAFAIKLKGWRSDDVIAYLKSGLTDIEQKAVDVFEIYVSTWKIKGNRFFDEYWTMNPDGFSSQISPRGLSILQTANEVKDKLTLPLSEFFTRLDAARNVSELCEATFDFFKSQDLPKKLAECAKKAFGEGDKKAALEISGAHKAFIKVLSDISAAMGDEEMSVEEFASSLKLVLGNTDIGTIPTAADEIILGSASMLRTSGIRCAILIGVCEGSFPAATSDCGFFSDNEKEQLKELSIELSSDTLSQNSEELLGVYRAVTLPSEQLFVLYNTGSGENGSQKPSIAVSRICALLPDLKKIKYDSIDEADKLMSKALAFEAFNRSVIPENRTALSKIFENDPKYSDIVKKVNIPVSDSECRISEEFAKNTFGGVIPITQSKLEKYIKCHFSYYCNYVLKLRESETAAFNYNDSGTFIHHVLEIFMKSVVGENGLKYDLGIEELKKIVNDEADSYISLLFKDKYPPSKRLLHLFDRLKRLTVIIALDLYAEVSAGEFVPTFFEMGVGYVKSPVLPPYKIRLNDGSDIVFSGTVDRVDIFKKDGNVYIKVVDYKSGTKKFDIKNIEKGLDLQMLLYLFAICNSDSKIFKEKVGASDSDKLKPAGITYISTNVSPQKTSRDISEQELIKLVSDKFTREGLIAHDEEIICALNKNVDKKYLAGVERSSSNDKKKDAPLFKGKALTTSERFSEIEKQITDTLTDIIGELRGGNASVAPMLDQKPCEYCKMKQFCRVELSDVDRIEDDNENEEDD